MIMMWKGGSSSLALVRRPAIRLVVLFGALAALVVLAACAQPQATPAPPPAATPAPTAAPVDTPTPVPGDGVEVRLSEHPEYGPILTDGEGLVLYLFTRDERETSNCTGGCLESWPPLLSDEEPVAANDVDGDRLGTIERDNGDRQVIYNGWPLYYFAGDAAPGEANGQDANNVWFVVSSYGGPVQTEAEVQVGEHPEFGEILTDASGRTLYLFTNDDPDVSNCTGNCALNWPPFLTVGDPAAADGIDDSLLGTTGRDDGTVQVTYNGSPLYYFFNDAGPGDASGQGLNDVWFVVTPQGEAVGQSDETDAGVETVQVVARNFEFDPSTIELQQGVTYRFEVSGEGSFHTFTVQSPSGETVLDVALSVGSTETVEFTPAETGEYYLFCRPHEGAGMTGGLHVHGGQEPTPTPTPTAPPASSDDDDYDDYLY